MTLGLLALLLLTVYALLFAYYSSGWNRLPAYESPPESDGIFLSVIIPARNEAATIPVLLKALEKQTLDRRFFEIIVMNDHSEDDTVAIVNSFSQLPLRCLSLTGDPDLSSKKKAIEAGIREAKGEWIITTDADCRPGANWLSILHAFIAEKQPAFVAAPVKLSYEPNLLQRLQAADFLMLQGITASSVFLRFHDMCNGANLAYRKSAFEKVKGFQGINQVATGDDMLLMHKIRKAFPDEVFYLKHRDAIVSTPALSSWKAFYQQRKRWASKSLIYKDARIIAVLAFVLLVQLFFIFLLVRMVFHPSAWWLPLGFILGKALIEFDYLRRVAQFFRQAALLPFIFLYQPFHILYTVVTGISSQFGKYEWKGRTTK